jgi:hypothetical protein
MSAPYNPASGNQPGEQPQWGGYPGGANYPQQEQPGYPGQGGNQQGDHQQGGYPPQQQQPGGYQQANYPQQQGGYGYQQPQGGSGYGEYGTQQSQSRQGPGIVGLAVAGVGAIVLVVGFFLNWYSQDGQGAKFSDFHKQLDGPGAPGFPKMYFGWLGWALLALVIIAAVLANLPIGPAAAVMRILAPVLGIVGAAVTLLALNNFWDKYKDLLAQSGQPADVGLFKHSAIGLYMALAGFVIAGIAGVFGPKRA